jgi:hypothetical protein
MSKQQFDTVTLSSGGEKAAQNRFTELLHGSPIPDDELLANLGLYLSSKSLSRILFFHEIYHRILHSHGVIFEFGVRWGQTLSILSALRGIFEPFNRHRKIVGFDTFEGFKGMSEKDGTATNCKDGSFGVPEGYENYLAEILRMQETLNPINHLKKYDLIKGDATDTIPDYLARHPETIISLAIFDFDIYKPTRAALETIRPHLCKGSILVFDELCDDVFPGETIALREVFGLRELRVERLPMTARVSFVEL